MLAVTVLPGAQVQLIAYERELRHARHRHDELTIALILQGFVREGVGPQERSAEGFQVGQKPPGLWHTDHFGPGGLAALRIALVPEVAATLPQPEVWEQWKWMPGGTALRPLLRLADGLCWKSVTETLLWDAIAGLHEPSRMRGSPPRWLVEAREAILDDPHARQPLATLAARVGVHPVYLARSFRAWFGCSVVAFRRRRMVERAGALLATSSLTIGQVAAHGSFYDQAALSRSFRRVTGVTPSRYRSIVTRAWQALDRRPRSRT